MSLLTPDDLQEFAIAVLGAYDGPPLERPHSEMAFHPADFLDEDGLHDYDLLTDCPIDIREQDPGAQLDWAITVCRAARTDALRNYDPVLLLREIAGED